MQARIRLILETERGKNARSICAKLNQVIVASDPGLSRYYKGGTSAVFSRDVVAFEWPEVIMEILQLTQAFGRSWTVTGDIDNELSLVTTEFSLAGITWAEVSIVKTNLRG
ncbi:MAG: hypothetical protein AAF221_14330 [Pseudomonadota bacterium]